MEQNTGLLTTEEIIQLHPAVMELEIGGQETPCLACAKKTARAQLTKCGAGKADAAKEIDELQTQLTKLHIRIQAQTEYIADLEAKVKAKP